MITRLSDILTLVGSLDDATAENAPRDRFRRFVTDSVKEVGQLRDFIQECLRNSGEQYNRALQDLVNILGRFLGFEVTFGRYRGLQGQIGFDGLWTSQNGRWVVVEVKTTDTYAIKTATLLGYIDDLISSKRISDRDSTLGLYIVGRPDQELKQLENAIVAEKRIHQLRTVSVESLLSLAEIMAEYDITHGDILELLWPPSPTIDPIVSLIARLGAQQETDAQTEPVQVSSMSESGGQFWLTPVKDHENETATECVQKLVGKFHVYAFGERTPGRRHMKPGDEICFYANTVGVVGHARIASIPEKNPHSQVLEPERFPYTVKLDSAHIYADKPIVVDQNLRTLLDAFQGRDIEKPWAWFVQATRKLTPHDFALLTGSASKAGSV